MKATKAIILPRLLLLFLLLLTGVVTTSTPDITTSSIAGCLVDETDEADCESHNELLSHIIKIPGGGNGDDNEYQHQVPASACTLPSIPELSSALYVGQLLNQYQYQLLNSASPRKLYTLYCCRRSFLG